MESRKNRLPEQFRRMQKLAGIITEDTEQTATGEGELGVRAIAKDSYPEFVKKLGSNILKPGFVQAIKTLSDKAPINTQDISVPVTKPMPTQNEIDIDKSLKYPLTDVESAQKCLKGGSVSIAGNNIVTGGGGSFIIDGHHRWSQLYCMNPQASITAMDIPGITDPMAGLKATQLGIAGDIGKVPVALVQGQNLLKLNNKQIKDYVVRTITPEVVDVFKTMVGMEKLNKGVVSNEDSSRPMEVSMLKSLIGAYIAKNVALMQEKNQPVAGAPGRGIMPQTDRAKNWQDDAINVQALKERTLQQQVNETLTRYRRNRLG